MKTFAYRQDIIDICNCKHLSIDEIFDKLKKKHGDVGKSSIYRNVEQMSKLGLLNKIEWLWNKAIFEKNIWKHAHIVTYKWAKKIQIEDIDYSNLDFSKILTDSEIKSLDIRIYK